MKSQFYRSKELQAEKVDNIILILQHRSSGFELQRCYVLLFDVCTYSNAAVNHFCILLYIPSAFMLLFSILYKYQTFGIVEYN